MASSRRTRSPDAALRRARLADAPALARVMRAAIRGLARGAYPPAQVEAWSSLPAEYHAWAMTAGGEAVWVAERAGRVVGYAALRRAEVTALFVLPSAGRRGIGTMLLATVERTARRRGLRRLVLRASLNGLAFYRSRGFAGTRRIRVPLPDGAHLDAVALAKTL